MSELRWILVGFSIVLLAGIYLWGRRNGRHMSDDTLPARDLAANAGEPTLEGSSAPAGGADEYVITAVRPAAAPSELRAPLRELTDDVVDSPPQRRGRVEPTLGSGFRETSARHLGDTELRESNPRQGHREPDATLDLPADDETPAPTLSSSETPPPKRIERRKILALRLSVVPQRIEGAKLQECLQSELLEHGKYGVFHRLHEGASVFSVASMMEPGTFDLEHMPETLYPGITLFAQLPGPVPGMHALNELVACARRLQQTLGGVLQDDRGVPLTVHRVERLRQEVREFERPPSARSGSISSSTTSTP